MVITVNVFTFNSNQIWIVLCHFTWLEQFITLFIFTVERCVSFHSSLCTAPFKLVFSLVIRSLHQTWSFSSHLTLQQLRRRRATIHRILIWMFNYPMSWIVNELSWEGGLREPNNLHQQLQFLRPKYCYKLTKTFIISVRSWLNTEFYWMMQYNLI